jgi:hypothetical protein
LLEFNSGNNHINSYWLVAGAKTGSPIVMKLPYEQQVNLEKAMLKFFWQNNASYHTIKLI